jgi:hypothetical protein
MRQAFDPPKTMYGSISVDARDVQAGRKTT